MNGFISIVELAKNLYLLRKMTDFQRLIKEWEAVKSFWNRDDNVSLSKHCDEAGVDYKRCITHNQPMRKQADTNARNKYADDQIAKFRAKCTPRNQQGAAPAPRRPSTTSTTSSKTQEDNEEVEALKEENERLKSTKNDLQDKVAELTAKVRRLEEAQNNNTSSSSSTPAFDWEKAYKHLYETKFNELNWWRRVATNQGIQVKTLRTLCIDNLVDVPATYTNKDGEEAVWNEREYEQQELKDNWWEIRKRKLFNPKPVKVKEIVYEEEE